MFDLIVGRIEHVPSTPAVPILISTGIQGSVLAAIVMTSLLFASGEMPAVPDVLAFVAEMPAAVPPPPPPPPAAPPKTAAAQRPMPTSAFVVPLEAPASIVPETSFAVEEEGVPGGVEGGISGGIVGGVAGIVDGPPPPPPPVRPEITRIGGQVQAPALLRRVEPLYPPLAESASIEGLVILDAIVGVDGRVQSVTSLRGNPLLAKAAIDAVKQWQYQPLLLNGAPAPFELTVSLMFHFVDKDKLKLKR